LESNKGLGEEWRAEKGEDVENALLLLESSERKKAERRICIWRLAEYE
jgi:hypothetical protein